MDARCLRVTAMLLLMCTSAIAQSPKPTLITFRNVGKLPVYVQVAIGTGDCALRVAKEVFLLRPGAERAIDSAGGDACYITSFLTAPSLSPFSGGLVKPESEVRIDDKSVLMTIKNEAGSGADSAPPAALASTVPDVNSGRGLGGLLVGPFKTTLIDDKRLTEIVASSSVPAGTHEQVLAELTDPTTPPQSKTDCVQEAWGKIPFDGEWRTCTGWRTQWRCMRRRFVLVAKGPDIEAIKAGVVRCGATAAVAGAIAALATEGAAAGPAVERTFYACMAGVTIVSLTVENRGGWTDWGGC